MGYNSAKENPINNETAMIGCAIITGSPTMIVSKSDPRSVRTRNQLRKALIELSSEKNFYSLTIKDITQLAGLNRTTFYLHYAGLHELLEDCARTLFSEMRTAIYGNTFSDFHQDQDELIPFIESVFLHLEQHEKFYRTMLGRQGNPLFRGLFQDLLSELIFEPVIKRTPAGDPNPQLEMTIRFFSSGFTGIAAWWLEKGKPVSIHQVSQQIAADILPGYLRLMGKG
jgi:AcrR family transcriptional regulator